MARTVVDAIRRGPTVTVTGVGGVDAVEHAAHVVVGDPLPAGQLLVDGMTRPT